MFAAAVSLLPTSWQPYAKTLIAIVTSLLIVASTATDAPEWISIALAILAAPLVYFTPNGELVRHDDANKHPDPDEDPDEGALMVNAHDDSYEVTHTPDADELPEVPTAREGTPDDQGA